MHCQTVMLNSDFDPQDNEAGAFRFPTDEDRRAEWEDYLDMRALDQCEAMAFAENPVY